MDVIQDFFLTKTQGPKITEANRYVLTEQWCYEYGKSELMTMKIND